MSRKISDYFKLKPKSEDKEEIYNKCEKTHEVGPKFIKQESCDNVIQGNCLRYSQNETNFMEKIIKSAEKVQASESKITGNVKKEPDQDFVIRIPNNIDQGTQKSIFKPTSLPQTKKSQKSLKNPRKTRQKSSIIPKISNLESKNDNKCKYCGKIFTDNTYIYDHVKRVHSDEIKDSLINCNLCGASFFTKNWLTQHMKRSHADGKVEIFICDLDGKILTNKVYLRSHMRKHSQKVECKICNVELKIWSLSNHMNSIHGNKGSFQCKICDKSFKYNQNLTRHEKIHDKKFECIICDKKFAHEREVKRHQKHFHENLKKATCDVCGKMFADKANLTQHSKVHDKNRPKPFKCHRCDHAATTMQRFKKHLTFHENQDKRFAAMKNPEKCDQCPMMCKNKFSLYTHQLSVHTINTHQCDLCGKYFKNRICFRGHMNFVHLQRNK